MIQDAIIKIVQKEDLSYDRVLCRDERDHERPDLPHPERARFWRRCPPRAPGRRRLTRSSGCAAAMRDHAIKFDANGLGVAGDRGHRRRRRPQLQHLLHRRHCDRRCRSAGHQARQLWPPPPRAVQPMCWRRWASTSSWSPPRWSRCFRKPGSASCIAQVYHTSMKYVGAIRKELGFRTVFNILGPLTNPAHPTMQVLGVYDEYLLEPLAQVLSSLGVQAGHGGLWSG